MYLGSRVRLGVTVLAIVCAALTAEAASAFASGTDARLDEYRVRASFLLKFAKFVQWPRDGSLTFCVTGDEEFGVAMTTMAGAANVGNSRDVVVRTVSPKGDFSKCDMVYVGRDATRHTADILKQIDGVPVLAVGESDAFLSEGGIVRVFIEDNKIRFQINGSTAEKRGLKISSQLLSLAAH
jgi:hypothetical protein